MPLDYTRSIQSQNKVWVAIVTMSTAMPCLLVFFTFVAGAQFTADQSAMCALTELQGRLCRYGNNFQRLHPKIVFQEVVPQLLTWKLFIVTLLRCWPSCFTELTWVYCKVWVATWHPADNRGTLSTQPEAVHSLDKRGTLSTKIQSEAVYGSLWRNTMCWMKTGQKLESVCIVCPTHASMWLGRDKQGSLFVLGDIECSESKHIRLYSKVEEFDQAGDCH